MFFNIRRKWSFHVVVLQGTSTKYAVTNIYNALVHPPFYSLFLLFGDILVAFGVVVCLSSLNYPRLGQFIFAIS